MAKENTNETPIATAADFPGLILNADPRDLPIGCGQVQVNATSEQAGSLMSRRGMSQVTFEGE